MEQVNVHETVKYTWKLHVHRPAECTWNNQLYVQQLMYIEQLNVHRTAKCAWTCLMYIEQLNVQGTAKCTLSSYMYIEKLNVYETVYLFLYVICVHLCCLNYIQ